MQLKFQPRSLITTVAIMAVLCALASCVQSNETLLTPSRILWIRNQCEAMVNEIEAIINQNVYRQFDIATNLRFIALYDALELMASKEIPELEWLHRKMKAYASQGLYQSVINIITTHLLDLDRRMVEIEEAEPKGRSVSPNKEWLQIYDSFIYIVTNSPPDSSLEQLALDLVQKSPGGNQGRRRVSRARLSKHAFNR